MDRRRFLLLSFACGGVLTSRMVRAQQALTAGFRCGPSVLSPYGPIAECKYSSGGDLPDPHSSSENVWAAAVCFVLRARGFKSLSDRLSTASYVDQSADAEDVLEWVSSRWNQSDGKIVKVEAKFAQLSEFSAWVTPDSFPVLIRLNGTPNVLMSAELRCNEQSGLCDYVRGLVLDLDTAQTRVLSLDEWKRADEFVRLDVLATAPKDASEPLPDNAEMSSDISL